MELHDITSVIFVVFCFLIFMTSYTVTLLKIKKVFGKNETSSDNSNYDHMKYDKALQKQIDKRHNDYVKTNIHSIK